MSKKKTECQYDGPETLYRGDFVHCYCEKLSNKHKYVIVPKDKYPENCPLLKPKK